MSEAEYETIDYDVPDDAEYANHPITDMGYNLDLDRVFVIYEDAEAPDGWDQLIFGAERDDGQARVTHFPPGLVPPERLEGNDSPGANEARELYDLLEAVGVEVARYD